MDSMLSVWKKIGRLGVTALVTGVLSVSLAACGNEAPAPAVGPTATVPSVTGGQSNSDTAPSDQQPTTDTNPVSGGGPKKDGQQVGIILQEWAIVPANLGIPAGKVTFVVKNEGEALHNLAILDASGKEVGKTPNFKKGEGPENLALDLQPGTYKMICTIPTHAEKGMVGTLTVGK